MAFRYTPAENRYVGSITDLMGRGNEAEAQALIKVANAQAQAAQASGQAWGGAIKGIGDTASQAITAWNTPEARLQREMDEAKRIQESGNKELRNVLVPDILGARPGQEVPVTPPVGLTAIQGANLFSGAPSEPRVGTTVSFDGDSTGEAQLDQLQSQSLEGDSTAWYNPKVVPPLQDFGKQGTGSSPSEIGMRQGGPRRPPFSLPDSNNLMQGFEDRASGGAIGQRPQLDREGNPVTRGRYTKDNGQYDIERLYGDLIKSGVSTEVANKFAMQGVESNTIFLTGADLAKKYEESQLQSAGAVARMALSAIDDLGMKPEAALKEAIAGGGAIPEELIRQFRIDFHGKNPGEQRAILEDLVRRSSFLGETTTVGAGDSVIGEGGEVLFEGTPKPENLTGEEQALDAYAHSLDLDSRFKLSHAQRSEYTREQRDILNPGSIIAIADPSTGQEAYWNRSASGETTPLLLPDGTQARPRAIEVNKDWFSVNGEDVYLTQKEQGELNAGRPSTADMRNKQDGRKLVGPSITAVKALSERVITLNGPEQRLKAIKEGTLAALGEEPEFKTYQAARNSLAGNLAVAQQGARPSDADIEKVWLPLVPDAYSDTAESAEMKWDLIYLMSNISREDPKIGDTINAMLNRGVSPEAVRQFILGSQELGDGTSEGSSWAEIEAQEAMAQ